MKSSLPLSLSFCLSLFLSLSLSLSLFLYLNLSPSLSSLSFFIFFRMQCFMCDDDVTKKKSSTAYDFFTLAYNLFETET